MGGINSGTRTNKKRTVGTCFALDAARLRQWGKFVPGAGLVAGSVVWTDEDQPPRRAFYDVDIAAGAALGTLRVMHLDEKARDLSICTIGLVATRCHLGGLRWWLACPVQRYGSPCGRRARKLYLCENTFGCRECHGLTYLCRQQSDKRVAAAFRAGTDLSEFEARPDMTLAEAIFAAKVFQADDARRERAARRDVRRRSPRKRAEYYKFTGRRPGA
ncbi:hypothetical protein [Limnoglobus roseus]|uniref:Uncharacterized protein n=1 Tax=Limnoglobus roseus TaxID=2598579 RepID=A0A5C1ANY8_9BACT|nr:hypothetical protein [Limnoglobus roseus]QEL19853.1 hypothetical protein PX52LOC_06934 [Limnoglobus roseus]